MRLLVVSCAPLISSFTLSLACLRLTAVTVHDAAETDPFHAAHLSYCAGTPFYASASSCLSFVFHTQSHMLMLLLMSQFFFTLATSQLCFDVFARWAPPHPSFPPVRPPVWWVNCGGTWLLAPAEMTCQMSHLINISPSLSSFVFDSVPSKPTLQAPCTTSPTCCDGTPMFRRYRGSFRQLRPVGCLSPSLNFPRPASQGRQQETAQRVRWSRKKAGTWPHSLPLSVDPDTQWLNLK